MELVVERAAGLDVGKDEVVACIRVPAAGVGQGRGRRRQEVRTYPTFTSSLETLADWLQTEGVTQVVMEATGQYWKPIWYVLEERGALRCCWSTPATSRSCPAARPTSVMPPGCVSCSECGLLRGSFVPPPAIRQLRDLTRYRKRLVQAHTAEVQRIQKTLEDAGIKLDSVATDVLGVSGRAILKALVAGERDPKTLAELAKGKLRKKLPQLRQALRGRFGDHHALLVGLALDHLEHLEAAIARLDARVDEVIAPFAVARDRLDTITGVGKRAAEAIIADRRRRHDRVPDRRAPGLLGGPLPRQQRHRGQAPLGQAHQGQPLAGRRADRVRLGRCQKPRHLPGRPALAAGPPHRQAGRPRWPWATPSW